MPRRNTLSNVLSRLGSNRPSWMFVTGGVTEPTWSGTNFLEQLPLNKWMLTRKYSVDCGPAVVALGSWDGVHPMPDGAQAYANCIEEQFPQAWEVPSTTTTTTAATSSSSSTTTAP